MSWIPTNMQTNGPTPWSATMQDAPYAGNGGINGPPTNGDGFRGNWWGSGTSGSTFGTTPSGASDASSMLGNANTMIGQLMALVQQYIGNLTSMLGGQAATPATGSTNALAQQPGSETFANATLSSTGDPHLALSGTATCADGSSTQVNAKFDSMTSHRDLFSTNDFGDGFRVATTVSQPNAHGITTNASATATMNGGRDSVTMGTGGTISVTSNGDEVALTAGQSLTLSGGETVTEATNGSVTIAEQGADGETLATTFSNNGSGVDVNATASGGVTLGGYLIRQSRASA